MKSGENAQAGIDALQQYLSDLTTTSIDTSDLPSQDWANLRLAELFMNNKKYDDAESALASIINPGDERFNDILKGLKKKLKKQA